MKEVGFCRLCGDDTRLVLQLRSMPLVDDYRSNAELYPVELYECNSCNFVQLGTVVEASKIFHSEYAYRTGSSLGLVKHFRELAENLVVRTKLSPNDLVVDIGCNDGTLLRELNLASRCRILGVDPAANAELPALCVPFSMKVAAEVVDNFGLADLAVATNVLAHVEDFVSFLKSVKVLLNPGGLFVCEVGSIEAITNGHAWETIYHEHLSYFSANTLVAALNSVGFVVEEIEELSTHGGSLRAVCFLNEASFEDCQHDFHDWSAVARSVEQRQEDIARLVGTTDFVGFGASAKASVLMWQTGLRPKFVIDDNPRKQGKFMPGTDIPIVGREELRKLRANYKVLVLAWNEAGAIVNSVPEFAGRLIVAAPVPYVV